MPEAGHEEWLLLFARLLQEELGEFKILYLESTELMNTPLQRVNTKLFISQRQVKHKMQSRQTQARDSTTLSPDMFSLALYDQFIRCLLDAQFQNP